LYGKNETSICELMTKIRKISLLYCHLRIGRKCQNPLHSYVQERESEREGGGEVHSKCTM